MKQYRQLKPFTHHQLLAIKAEFIPQSLTAAKGKPESLAWFDSLIKPWQKNLVTRQPVLVMDFGGSYFRSGVAEVDDNQQLIWRRALISVKIVREYTNVDTFVNWLADKTAPLIKQLTADRVGFVFSHAFDSKKSNGHITGIITYLSKALVIPGLLGKDLGRFFLKALQLRGLHLKKFVMLNDTVALALCAKNAPAGLVIGTGAYLCSLHPTLPHLRNLEAGHFNGVPFFCQYLCRFNGKPDQGDDGKTVHRFVPIPKPGFCQLAGRFTTGNFPGDYARGERDGFVNLYQHFKPR